MLTRYALLFVSCSAAICGAAERIYIMPGTGYNQCDPLLVTAIQSQGHTVIVALGVVDRDVLALPLAGELLRIPPPPCPWGSPLRVWTR